MPLLMVGGDLIEYAGAMDIDLLRSFLAFVESGSFTGAANKTFKTQSAISMQMKRLEQEGGRALFAKEGRNRVLTDDGKLLASYARRIVTLHDEALGQLKSVGEYPPLRIGCPDDYVEQLMPELLRRIRRDQPALRVSVTCATSVALRGRLDSGELDLAIVTRSPDGDEGYLLAQDRGTWMAAPGSSLPLQSVLPLVLYGEDCKFHTTAVDGLEKQGRAYQVLCTTTNACVIQSMVRSDQAISAVARLTVPADLEAVDHSDLPSLPAIDIVLLPAPQNHDLLTPGWIKGLSERV